MTSVIPPSRMVVIVIIIMRFIATRQCGGSNAYEEEHTECVLYLVFHGGDGLSIAVHKPCQYIKGCPTAISAANMPKNVDISPQTQNATKVV